MSPWGQHRERGLPVMAETLGLTLQAGAGVGGKRFENRGVAGSNLRIENSPSGGWWCHFGRG